MFRTTLKLITCSRRWLLGINVIDMFNFLVYSYLLVNEYISLAVIAFLVGTYLSGWAEVVVEEETSTNSLSEDDMDDFKKD